jgi:hypothetical protein
MDIAPLLILFLLLGGKKSASASSASSAAKAGDGASYVRRANQAAALAWVPFFKAHDVSQTVAHGLARWAGIESSGVPTAVSPIGERGLLQCTKTTRKGLFNDKEWDSFTAVNTSRDEHARLAVKLYKAMLSRAMKRVANPPADDASKLWYAKIQHARPKDLVDVQMHGPALQMARDLATRWKGDNDKMGRLYSANVVAFGNPTP